MLPFIQENRGSTFCRNLNKHLTEAVGGALRVFLILRLEM
jgi:hypothetical protein